MIVSRSPGAAAPHWDKEQVKQAARGRWEQIIPAIANISLPGRTGSSCPKCGGTDRFNRHNDFAETGGLICRRCFSENNHDGFAALGWLTGMSFSDSVDAVGDFLCFKPKESTAKPTERKRQTINDVTIEEWPSQLAVYWCSLFPPISEIGLRNANAASIKFNGKSYLGFPAIGQSGKPSAWTILDWSGELLTVGRGDSRSFKKTKLVDGSKPGGVIGSVAGQIVWKVEGPKDLAAFYSATSSDIAANREVKHSAFSCSHGAEEKPQAWILEQLKGKLVVLVPDCDEAGVRGCKKWSKALADCGIDHRIINLPFEEGSKKDLRDYFAEGGTFEALKELVRQSAPIELAPPELRVQPGEVIAESVDDPFRLARENLAFYQEVHRGKLIYWMGSWYSWKGTKYEIKSEEEIKTHLLTFIEKEFQREFKEAVAARREVEHKRKVSSSIVANTYAALKSLCLVSDKIQQPSWLDGRPGRDVVAVTNGLVDLGKISRVVFERDGIKGYNDAISHHDPNWFSTVCLRYAYEPASKCQAWERFLLRALDGDELKVALLQEWAGYLLLPDTSHHKFLCIQGSGANGKSVFLAAMTAMLGEENVSNVPLEQFGDRFSLYRTLGKLANIVDEVPAEEMPEARIKAFTAGNRMSFEDKGKPLFEATPTARLMFSCNEKPRFRDPTGAMWRRMLYVPFGRPVTQAERVNGMDKPQWWVESGELPGMLMWAIRGLHRLRNQGCFSASREMEAEIEQYRRTGNPIREFLSEHFRPGEVDSYVISAEAYQAYRKWAIENGFYPASSNKFALSVQESFPGSRKDRVRINGIRTYIFRGLVEDMPEFGTESSTEFSF